MSVFKSSGRKYLSSFTQVLYSTQQLKHLFLPVAWPTSSIIPPPSTPTAAVITRLTRTVRVPSLTATPTRSSAAMATPASAPPSSTWSETCCRVSASWWLRSSSTFGSDIDHVHVRVRPKCQFDDVGALIKIKYDPIIQFEFKLQV